MRRRVGDIVKVDLGEGYFGFGWVLEEPLMAFFSYRSQEEPEADEIAEKSIAFRILVMNHAVTKGVFPVVGNVEPPADVLKPPPFFKHDAIANKVFITYDGSEEISATRAECVGMEAAAVWEPEHVVDRLRDYFAGRPNKWEESLKLPDSVN